jgi:polyhydroxyalkanoate depolymerase
MPASMMDGAVPILNTFKAAQIPLTAAADASTAAARTASLGFDLARSTAGGGFSIFRRWLEPLQGQGAAPLQDFFETGCGAFDRWMAATQDLLIGPLESFARQRAGESEFLKLFSDAPPCQELASVEARSRLLLETPSLRLWDVSADVCHDIDNYTVVFAPRAGHHSNIAERAAMFLRDHGMTRMAIVEQKCAEEIPLYIDGRRHRENFEGQVLQYREILCRLKDLTGRPAHLVAVCQPGPLLMATLILYPGLGRSFGSAGAPMHTEAQPGFLTDFSRAVGPQFIDLMLMLFGRQVRAGQTGQGRPIYDGRLQVLGFYLLGWDRHLANFKRLLTDLQTGRTASAQRQIAFYHWYNTVHHFPAGFIRDTFKKIFVGNELVRGRLSLFGRTIGIGGFPAGVPLWALGGENDEIAPPLQATGHMDLIDSVGPRDKLTLRCQGGHMGLFRSERVLAKYYTQIAGFLLDRSDFSNRGKRVDGSSRQLGEAATATS